MLPPINVRSLLMAAMIGYRKDGNTEMAERLRQLIYRPQITAASKRKRDASGRFS